MERADARRFSYTHRMRWGFAIAWIATVLSLSACDATPSGTAQSSAAASSAQTKTSTSGAFSCVVSKAGQRKSCMEYVETETPREHIREKCVAKGSTFQSGPCPTEGSAGYCETAVPGVTIRNHYYGSGGPSFARGCKAGGGVFKPL